MGFQKTGDVGKAGTPVPLEKVNKETEKSSKKVSRKPVPRKQGG
jgi:hypothetical protein